MDYQDKVVLVTGAGRGLGRAIAQAFAQKGAVVAVNDLTSVNLDETLGLIRSSGGRAKEYLGDVSQKMAIQGIIVQVVDDWGRLDVLINNAAVQPRAALLEMDEWDWRRVLDVNLTGSFFATQIAGRVMRTLGGGVIVNIGDAVPYFKERLHRAAYATSKAALLELTRQAARELAPFNIRVNAICPGLIESEAFNEEFHSEKMQERLSSSVVNGGLGTPQDVANLTLFVCSDLAAYINGQVLSLDGGGMNLSIIDTGGDHG